MVKIKIMNRADIKFAKTMTDAEGWGYLRDDFRRLVSYEPDGCFVAWENRARVGIITTTSYRDYAFVGSLIVEKAKRGKGIGKMLLSHAVEYLRVKGVRTIELDGVFPAVVLYRRMGFKDKYLSLRFLKRAEKGGEGGKGNKGEEGEYKTQEVEAVVDFDREMTGLDRERVIRRLLKDFGDVVYVIKERKKLSGYAIVRQREGGYFLIGSWVAENRRAAEAVLSSIVERYSGRTLTVGVPEINRRAVEMVLGRGFVYSSQPSLRMFWGERIDYEKNIYGILSPEKG
jgi:GNAT superfamily N-acetyltransferase